MKLAEYLDDLDPKLAADLERALEAVRGEFEEKIASTVRDTVSAAATEAAAVEAAAREQVARAEAVAPQPPATLSLDAADELRLAALEIDTASSQSEILEALTRGVLRFSSRVAIFVNRGQDVHGWSASGFGSADATIKEVSLSAELPFPIGARLSSGAIALPAEDCALICDALRATPPSMGVLLPFVLGSQVVGTVYCDRRDDDPFSVSALQLLTYIAGQTLETLPVRKRESTATLSLARGSSGSGSAAAAPTPEPAPAPAPSETPEKEATLEAAPETLGVEPEIELDAEPEPVVDDFRVVPEEPSDSRLETPDAPRPEPALPQSTPEPLAAVDEESTRPGTLTPEPAPAPVLEALPASTPPAAAPLPVADSDQNLGATVEPAISSLSSTQVAPPDDLQGPGWAFTGGGEASEANSESDHEEAQRLARLLVTEIKLYNEEAVEQGRRDGNVYSRLQEDIDRSRQIFEDRIDPDVRGENDYFKQALVRILAGGDPTLLGI